MAKKIRPKEKIQNSRGKVFYGMHFYPGIATARPDPDKPEIKVFLNSSTIRKMDASFSGCPVYVLHVDEVEDDLDELRKEADGWVTESFYNAADGKHWAKLMIVSERGLRAVEKGYRLSNCYVPKAYKGRGIWNGIQYDREVADGAYEHMAIVPNPRYDESVILTPEQFHAYNESQDREIELTRLANERETKVKLKLFTRKKVENSGLDLDETLVQLPRSGKEVTLAFCVKNADDAEATKGKKKMANAEDMVEARGKKMTVAGLLQNYDKVCDELAEFKAASEDSDDEGFENEDDEDMDDADGDDMENAEDDAEGEELENDDLDADEDDGEVKAKKKKDDGKGERAENSRTRDRRPEPRRREVAAAPKRKVANTDDRRKVKAKPAKTPEEIQAAKDRAKRVANARDRFENDDELDAIQVETASVQVQRGVSRYG